MRGDRTIWWRPARWIGLVLGSLAMLGPGDAASARGQEAVTSGPHGARALLGQVADAYKALTSYSDEGQFVVAMTVGGKSHREAQPLRLTFRRPNQIDLDAGSVRLISDGKTLTTVVRPLKKYTTVPAPATIGMGTFREGPAGALLFGGPTGAPTFVLLNLLLGTSPDVLLDDLGGTIRSETARGKPPESTILLDLRNGPDLLLRVDPSTKLLSAIELKIDPAQLANGPPPGQPPAIEQFGWTAGTVSTRLPADRSFAFVAPKGFSPTPNLKARPGDLATRLEVRRRGDGREAGPRLHPDPPRRPRPDADCDPSRSGRQDCRHRFLGDLVRPMHHRATRDPEARRPLQRCEEGRADRRAEPGHVA